MSSSSRMRGAAGKECVRTGHRKRVTALGWNCTGLYLATGSADKEIIIHQHNSEKDLCSKTTPSHVRLRAHQDSVNFLEWNSTDPNMLASASDDCYIYFWDIKNPSRPTHTYKLGSKAFFLTWSKDGNKLCCLLTDDSLLLLDRRSPKETVQKSMGFRLSEAFYAAADNILVLCREQSFEIYNVQNPKNPLAITSVFVSPGQVKSIDIDPQHGFIVTGSSDGSVSFWSTQNLTCQRSLRFSDRGCSVTKVRISHNSSFLASSGDDCKIYVTGTQSDQPMAKIDHRNPNLIMCWNPRYMVLAYNAMPVQEHHHYHRSAESQHAICRLWQPPKRS